MTGNTLRYLALILLLPCRLFAQEAYFQNIRGTVIDHYTRQPLSGATIVLSSSTPPTGTTTEANGSFLLMKVPVGRIDLEVRYLGYAPYRASRLLVTSGKELFLAIELEETAIRTDEVVIKAGLRKDRPINEMATVSARSFSIEETNRYAGSLGDPARMAANYAGVMAETPQRNDIIIRGNSPTGLLWRLDDIEIPNPSHFGSLGTTGGPVTILNNNLLTNSDFYSGAFPAEYGNALAGAFDLRMRQGNPFKRQYWAQIGWNGIEMGAEGFFSSKSAATYLVSGRYSFLDLLGRLKLIGYQPIYSDLTFKVDLPVARGNKLSLIGLGGTSHISIKDSEKDTSDWTYSHSGEDLYFESALYLLGLSYVWSPNPRTSLRMVLSIQNTHQISRDDTISFAAPVPFRTYVLSDQETQYSYSIQHVFRPKAGLHFNSGISIKEYHVSFVDSSFQNPTYHIMTDIRENLLFFQAFSQYQQKWSNGLTFNLGLHAQYLPMNHSLAIEPRAGLRWEFLPNQSLSVGYGLHSQMQPRMIYFYRTNLPGGQSILSNKNLGFSRSHHLVLGYDFLYRNNFRIKAETYYQYLFDIPVKKGSLPQYSMLNAGDNFDIMREDSLVNDGTGTNKGIELTVEKFFANNYYGLFTLSLYDSKYRGYDGIQRNTAFNGRFIMNVLGGYELQFNSRRSLTFDGKIMWAGGKRYVPILVQESMKAGETILDWDHAYEEHFGNFLRIDLRIGYSMNFRRMSHKLALDFQNITNHRNILLQKFDPATGRISNEFQIGFFPMITWKAEW